jgi:adenylyltransferase/sulfurtransferase
VEGGFEPGAPYRVVVDGSDNFPTKYLINDVCALAGLPWVYSAILGFEGQLSVFNCPPGVGPDYRDLLPVPPPPGDVPSCAEGGVLGVLPGTLGCLQAVECLKLLLGESTEDDEGLCAGRVLVFDALKMKFSEVGLARTPGREPVSDLIDYQGFCGGPSSSASSSASPAPPATSAAPAAEAGPPVLPTGTRINGAIEFAARPSTPRRTMDESADAPDDAAGAAPSPSADSSAPRFHSISPGRCFERLRSGWSPWVVDVRLGAEHDIVALPFTDRVVPHREVSPRDVPKGGDVLVYCKGGVRGKKACEALAAQGVDPARLYNLRGGILQWQREVDPSMPRY